MKIVKVNGSPPSIGAVFLSTSELKEFLSFGERPIIAWFSDCLLNNNSGELKFLSIITIPILFSSILRNVKYLVISSLKVLIMGSSVMTI